MLSDLRSNDGGGNEDNGGLFPKVPCTHCYTQCPRPCSRPPPTHAKDSCQRLLDIHGQVRVSLLWGHCSFLLGPGVHKVLFVPSKSLFPQSCVSSMIGLMVTSSRRLKPYPGLLHPEPLLLWQITADSYLCSGHSKHPKAGLAQSLWGFLVCTRFCLSPLRISGRDEV